MCKPLYDLILLHDSNYSTEAIQQQVESKKEVPNSKQKHSQDSASNLCSQLTNSNQLSLDLAQEKGASNQLTGYLFMRMASPYIKVHFVTLLLLGMAGYHLTFTPPGTCGKSFTVEHALFCPLGGFPSIRHNEIRDLTATLMAEVCHNVYIEPTLQPMTGETFSTMSANKEDGVRSDIAADGFWVDLNRHFWPYGPSNQTPTLSSCYRKHENIKNELRYGEVEWASFTPIVLSSTRGMGSMANTTVPANVWHHC